ncbi:MAG TPA: M23 family metallopeptidase [Longimicrobiales bacterium]|jgi:murein DD-endopeptidase MepM/ murein hydrolase activator NlpD
MARGRWTLVIVSDDPTRVRQVRLSRDAVRLAVAVALLVFSALGSLAVGFFVKESERVTARRLARKNALLEAELAGIKEGMAALRAALEELSKKDAHFRLVAGLEPLDEEVLRAGIGGPGTETLESNPLWKLDTRLGEQTFTTAYDLNTMLRRAQVLAASWDAALNTLEQRYEELEATPSIAPVVGYVSSAFSRQRWHPILERPRPHEGVDIVAPKGAPIYATARGRVTFAGRNGAYGLMVEIDHGRGYVTRYAHASRTLVRRGQLVERGQKIAEVGDTGLAVAPHVHYEVLVNGRPVNPQLHILNEEVIPD